MGMKQGELFEGKTRCGYCGRELEPHGFLADQNQIVYQCPAFPGCIPSRMLELWREWYS